MRVRHWMQVVLFLAGALCCGFAVPTSHSTVVPLGAATRTPTPTSMPGPPVLSQPADGALLPQPVSPNEWYFSWEARTSGVEQASFTACLPLILRGLQFAPPPASTATPPPTASPTATQTPTPTATSTPIIHIVTAEGTLTRVYVSICQAGETHFLPESGVYLYSDSVSLHAYEGRYVRILGWSVPSPECKLVNVTDILELPGG
jgi:hypothetical protein